MDVTIDDDTGTLEDTFISKTTPTTNYGASSLLSCQWYSSSNRQSTLLGVDLSAYSGITVTSARFGLDVYAGGFPVPDLYWYMTIPEWIEAQATYNVYATGNNWNTAGCLGSGFDHASVAENAGSPKTITGTNSDEQFEMTTASIEAALGGFASIVVHKESILNAKYFFTRSSEAVLGNKPYFYMEYTEGGAGDRSPRRLNLLLIRGKRK